MEFRERILKCIRDIKGEEFNDTTDLIIDGHLDSLDIMILIEKFELEFDIIIPMDEADPDYFNTLDSIERLVKRNMGGVRNHDDFANERNKRFYRGFRQRTFDIWCGKFRLLGWLLYESMQDRFFMLSR